MPRRDDLRVRVRVCVRGFMCVRLCAWVIGAGGAIVRACVVPRAAGRLCLRATCTCTTALAACCGFDLCHMYILYLYLYLYLHLLRMLRGRVLPTG